MNKGVEYVDSEGYDFGVYGLTYYFATWAFFFF